MRLENRIKKIICGRGNWTRIQNLASGNSPDNASISPTRPRWSCEKLSMKFLRFAEEILKNIALAAIAIHAAEKFQKIGERIAGLVGKERRESSLVGGLDFGLTRHREILGESGLEGKRSCDPGEETIDRPHAKTPELVGEFAKQFPTTVGIDSIEFLMIAAKLIEFSGIQGRFSKALENDGQEFPG